jgi:hypothetical protein
MSFRVGTKINQYNRDQFQGLTNYFEKNNFDPDDLMMSDCSSCDDRWCNEYEEKEWTYVPVHFLDFSDDKVTCDKIEYIGYVNDDELMNEEQVM